MLKDLKVTFYKTHGTTIPEGLYTPIEVINNLLEERGISYEDVALKEKHNLSQDPMEVRLAYEMLILPKGTKIKVVHASATSLNETLRANENNKLITASGSKYAAVLKSMGEAEVEIMLFELP